MAHERDLPTPLAAVHPTRRIPHVAETFSAFSVLLYYAITSAAALRLRPDERRWPRWLAWAGLTSFLLLAASLPRQTIALGVAALAIAMISRAMVRVVARARS